MKSNDRGLAVRIEIRAAELHASNRSWSRGDWTERDHYGYDCAVRGQMPDRDSELAGWLCHEIDDHELVAEPAAAVEPVHVDAFTDPPEAPCTNAWEVKDTAEIDGDQ